MADYAADISPADYLYSGSVYYTEPTGQYRETAILKLRLTGDNFNFNLAKSDGTDFRLAESSGGGKVLNMWIAKWDKINEHAILFFKGKYIGGGTSSTFTAFWGKSDDLGISDGESIGALFYEDFNSNLSGSKWVGDLSNGVTSNGYYFGRSTDFTTITSPLDGVRNWIVECGLYTDFNHDGDWDLGDWAVAFEPIGTENGFYIGFMHSNRIETNVLDGSDAQTTDTYKGLEGYSYQEAFLVYNEPEDKFTAKLIERNTFPDSSTAWSRNVEGDTRITNLKLMGAQTSYNEDGAYPSYAQWLIVREFDSYDYDSTLDGSGLYREYEHVPPQPLDPKAYASDITSSDYYHSSSFGGKARNLSIDLHDSDGVVWISDPAATSESSVDLTIGYYGRLDLTSRRYYHYDTGHIYFYNASKLSNNDGDVWGKDWFEATTTSGWVSIKYEGVKQAVSYLSIKAMDVGRPKNFTFYANTTRPIKEQPLGISLLNGIFEDTDGWQNFPIDNTGAYRYYTLYIYDTYDDANIKIQEWEMRSSAVDHGKRYVAQLRLHPYVTDDYVTAFPKMVQLEGSNDLNNWTVVMPWRSTYTPGVVYQTEYGYWQRYSFTNIKGFYNYRLVCQGNWGRTDGVMSIGEWSMHELETEEITYRILPGTIGNIEQVWCNPGTTFDNEGEIYLALEDLAVISKDKLSRVDDLPEGYTDFNVVGD